MGSRKPVLIRRLFFLFFVRSLSLQYSLYNESDKSNEEEYEKIGSGSGSAGTVRNILGGLLYGIGLPLRAMLYADE